MNDAERKKNIRRTTLIVAMIALAFYLGFILMGVVRA
tara:strand:- start:307 stop:417 length:111 start_codon:yes stop_codon:yes gene_type:complete